MRTPSTARSRAFVAALLLALLVALPTGLFVARDGAFAPWGSGPSGAATAPPGRVLIAPAFLPGAGTVEVGPLPASSTVEVAVGLAGGNESALAAAIALEYTPGSPAFHVALSPSEVAERFGASPSTYASAVAYFRSEGLSVTTSPDRLMLLVAGDPGTVGSAFSTSFAQYSAGGHLFYSHPTAASLPSGIPWSGAVGLGDANAPVPFAMASPVALPAARASSGCPVTDPMEPCLAARAYNLTPILASGDNGSGYRLGVVDAYDGAEPQTQLASDVVTFSRQFGLPNGNVSFVYPVPTTQNLNTSTSGGWATEDALDLEWAHGMAPGASIDMTLSPNPTGALYDSVDWLVAHQAVNVISMSWGEPDVGSYDSYSMPCSYACNASADGSYGILHPVFEEAAAEGISLFAATGDCGAADGTSGLSTSYPASDPYVTAVGGTQLGLNATGGWAAESGWSGNASGSSSPGCVNQGGSGGGFSPFPRPSWQSAAGLPARPNERGIPDVAAVAAGPTAAIVLGGQDTAAGGTSLSSPIWAGIAADADSRAGLSLGFLNPSLYAIARGSSGHLAYHDVSTGWNGYSAGTGWDAVTGLGSPNASALLPLLSKGSVAPSTLSVGLAASARLGRAPLTVRFDASPTGGSRSYPLIDIDLGDGNASLAVGGLVTHTYTRAGVYAAIAVVDDSGGNSSASIPIAIVVGGGAALAINLTASSTSPSVGSSVTFRTTVTGGSGPFSYLYEFGDGTYDGWTSAASVIHTFGAIGGACAVVVVADALAPPDGGAAPPVALGIGGAAGPSCPSATALAVTVSARPTAADLPGDLNLSAGATGGVAPYSVTYTSSDAYATACRCGLFARSGNATITATVADSIESLGSASTNVTLYPALVARFTSTALAGPAPLTVVFTASVSGGHGASAASTSWTFGDGNTSTGTPVASTYDRPGFYTAVGLVRDAFGGADSEAFLVDVTDPAAPAATTVTATVRPAVDVPAGTLVSYNASVNGTDGPYLVGWSLGQGGSGFGANLSQSYAYEPCLDSGGCPMAIALNVSGANGTLLTPSLNLTPEQRGNASALGFAATLSYTTGSFPLFVSASANLSGMPFPRVSWSFGEGPNTTGTTASHTYTTPGNFTVAAVATDLEGDRLVRSWAVTVVGRPSVAPLIYGGTNVSSGLAPLKVLFIATASGGAGGPYDFTWAFGDGTIGTGATVAHSYANPGAFDANLTVLDGGGDVAFADYPIRVFGPGSVGLEILGLAPSLLAGSSATGRVNLTPLCDNNSLPGCGSGSLPLNLTLSVSPSQTSGLLLWETNLTNVDPSGEVGFVLPVPSIYGTYVLTIAVRSPAYVGSISQEFTSSGNSSTGCLNCTAAALSPLVYVGIAGAAVGAALIAVVILRRRWAPKRPGSPSIWEPPAPPKS